MQWQVKEFDFSDFICLDILRSCHQILFFIRHINICPSLWKPFISAAFDNQGNQRMSFWTWIYDILFHYKDIRFFFLDDDGHHNNPTDAFVIRFAETCTAIQNNRIDDFFHYRLGLVIATIQAGIGSRFLFLCHCKFCKWEIPGKNIGFVINILLFPQFGNIPCPAIYNMQWTMHDNAPNKKIRFCPVVHNIHRFAVYKPWLDCGAICQINGPVSNGKIQPVLPFRDKQSNSIHHTAVFINLSDSIDIAWRQDRQDNADIPFHHVYRAGIYSLVLQIPSFHQQVQQLFCHNRIAIFLGFIAI